MGEHDRILKFKKAFDKRSSVLTRRVGSLERQLETHRKKPDSLDRTLWVDTLEQNILTAKAELRQVEKADRLQELMTDDAARLLKERLDRIDAERFDERRIKLISDCTKLLPVKPTKSIDEKALLGLHERLQAVASKLEDGTSKQAAELLAKFRETLNELDGSIEMPSAFTVPEKAAPRTLDLDRALLALDRDDLFRHMARNDTWGDFDPDKLDLDELSEQQAKVIWNVIESAIAAQQADLQWDEYSIAVGKERTEQPTPTSTTDSTSMDASYDRSRLLSDQAPVETVYKLAILGAGASAAYQISNGNVDRTRTVIIGQKDPWAGERGGDEDAVINHPHNMIDPSGSPNFEGGLAKRSEFAKRVAKVLDSVPNHCDGKIKTIAKRKSKDRSFFEIHTAKGIYAAERVVSALGIGPHIDRLKADWEGHESEVRDMDVFMRDLPEIEKKNASHRIAVSGGNAAIDIVTAIIRKSKATVHWFCGSSESGPAFLDGTDNDIAKQAYNDGKGNQQVKVHKGRWAVKKEEGKILMYLDDEAVEVDEVVYGVGPDTSVINDLFDESCFEPDPEAETVYDRDQHFHLSLTDRDPDKLVDSLTFPTTEAKEEIRLLLKDPALNRTDLDGLIGHTGEFDPETEKPRNSDGLAAIGGQRSRQETRDRDGTATSPLARFNDNVLSTLPGNVVIGDQLTSSRARIEATENAMPTTEDGVPLIDLPGGVNFITSNQTVIATHIASCYPDIPPGLADYLTVQIVVSRNDEAFTPLPTRADPESGHDLGPQREFQNNWVQRLKKCQDTLRPN